LNVCISANIFAVVRLLILMSFDTFSLLFAIWVTKLIKRLVFIERVCGRQGEKVTSLLIIITCLRIISNLKGEVARSVIKPVLVKIEGLLFAI